MPLHPRTIGALKRANQLDQLAQSTTVVDPVGYLDMLQLERSAALIITDSGGVQKEAYFHCVPCVTVREETEWIELVDSGWNRLADPHSSHAIRDAALAAVGSQGSDGNLYGDGHAAEKIIATLECAASGSE